MKGQPNRDSNPVPPRQWSPLQSIATPSQQFSAIDGESDPQLSAITRNHQQLVSTIVGQQSSANNGDLEAAILCSCW